ncbi:hypothetical protein K504DRAFT_534224 [Pleomassaria siparia CBS 279.74]|uniref:Uncharacterized protein n=1 Tax=Pleomassaria siparia CBS 279.74 TaxID=1314801 RepID=A0A6G1K769_9PLEO|nr:hypothetical protein K504DRAFT_534224 [Pleomassaria siparia CBS 279.74]
MVWESTVAVVVLKLASTATGEAIVQVMASKTTQKFVLDVILDANNMVLMIREISHIASLAKMAPWNATSLTETLVQHSQHTSTLFHAASRFPSLSPPYRYASFRDECPASCSLEPVKPNAALGRRIQMSFD